MDKAITLLMETIDILFKETDRVRGWKKLVDSTKIIGAQTSRLLVVIYGSEQKRLEAAANAALNAIAKVKQYALLPENQLRPVSIPHQKFAFSKNKQCKLWKQNKKRNSPNL